MDRPSSLGGEAGDGDILVMAMDGVIGHIMVAGEVGVIQSMVAIMVAIHSIQVMGMVIGLVGENKSIISFHKGPGIIESPVGPDSGLPCYELVCHPPGASSFS